jgi:hypothetical protein
LVGLPVRTYGALQHTESGLVFIHRPWLVLPARRTSVSEASAIGKGLISPVVLRNDAGKDRSLFRLPPRYRAMPDAVAAALGGLPVKDVSFGRGLKAAIAWVREQLSGSAPPAASAVPSAADPD